MPSDAYPIGKLPPELLKKILAQNPINDERVLVGPGVGLDCAVIDVGTPNLLVVKSEPITFAMDEIGWYALQVAANDIVTTGALPLWYTATVLLPENKTDEALVMRISEQLAAACNTLHVALVGGHTEVTHGLSRPIIMGTLFGEVPKDQLVTPRGAKPGHSLLLTKGVPIEATALLAREFPAQLFPFIGALAMQQAAGFLRRPGISVVQDARLALRAGRVTAMHDPTEGGLAGALWELAEASGNNLLVDIQSILIPQLSQRICSIFDLNPLATLASGALLLTTYPEDVETIIRTLKAAGIACREIGRVEKGPGEVWQINAGIKGLMPRPIRDEIAKVYEQSPA